MAFKFNIPPETANIPFKDGATIKVKRLSQTERIKYQNEAKEKGFDKYSEKDDKGNIIESEKTFFISERCIIGWDGIVDEKGAPIPFNDYTRFHVFELLLNDKESLEAFTVFLKGNSGN